MLVVADSSIVANESSGVVFVVGADKTSRHAARERDRAARCRQRARRRVGPEPGEHRRHPYYYSSYYRKDYARYYVKSGTGT